MTARRPCPEPDRLLGCLLGGGIGDALGAPVEGIPLDRIRATYGPEGPADYSPGRSTLSALRKAAARQKPGHPLGTTQEPINDSKGCGGVMRTAPCAFGTPTPEGPFTPEGLETLGSGFTGETALAIALYVMLHAERDAPTGTAAETALPRAVNHSGDSAQEFGPRPPTQPGGYGGPPLEWLSRYPDA